MVKKKAAKKTPGRKKKVKSRKTVTRQMKPEKEEKKKTKVKFKSVMPREEAISYFEAIVAGLKRGSIQIRQGDDSITLNPTPQLDVAVKAAAKDRDEKIVFEIGWRTASDSGLTISTE